jgi:antitoxin ParD1/3/4
VDAQLAIKNKASTVRQLIRRDQECKQLRSLLVEGAQSAPAGLADDAYFASLRSGINSR